MLGEGAARRLPAEANQAGDTMMTRRVFGVSESATDSSTLTMP